VTKVEKNMGSSVTFALSDVVPGRNLSWYLQKIHAFPILSPEEELALSKRWRDHSHLEAANKLDTSHLRLVTKIAAGYRGSDLLVGDLIGEGIVGMMQAVERFDPDRDRAITMLKDVVLTGEKTCCCDHNSFAPRYSRSAWGLSAEPGRGKPRGANRFRQSTTRPASR
jgi:Sigma-70 region 2/Sigma-70 factor, region 1.2